MMEIMLFLVFIIGFMLGLIPYAYLGKWRRVARFLKAMEKKRNLIVFWLKQNRTIDMTPAKYYGSGWAVTTLDGEKPYFFRIEETFHLKGLPTIVTTDGIPRSMTYEELLTTQLLQHKCIFNAVAEKVEKIVGKKPSSIEELKTLMDRYPQLRRKHFRFGNRSIYIKNIPGQKVTPDLLATIPIQTMNSVGMAIKALLEESAGFKIGSKFNILKIMLYAFIAIIILYIALQLFSGGIPLPIGQGFR